MEINVPKHVLRPPGLTPPSVKKAIKRVIPVGIELMTSKRRLSQCHNQVRETSSVEAPQHALLSCLQVSRRCGDSLKSPPSQGVRIIHALLLALWYFMVQKVWVMLLAAFNMEYIVLWGVSWKPHIRVKPQTGLRGKKCCLFQLIHLSLRRVS